jgi:histidinol-phosphate phosphatase family protein
LIVVDDRGRRDPPLAVGSDVEVLPGRGRGPASARNIGLRAASAEWVAYLDDDVLPGAAWRAQLVADLSEAGPRVAAVQSRIEVPLPADRPPTDWERNVAGLARARWATADMAFRRSALDAAGGFDERFRRAYREDSDVGLRLKAAGYEIVQGKRGVLHPVRPASRWVSLQLQAGNADDALMDALHGRSWRARADAPRGRLARHLVTSAAGVGAAGALALGRRRFAAWSLAAWAAGTAELAWARIAPGPRTLDEVALMAWTSALMPPVATFHRARGKLRARRLAPSRAAPHPPEAVLLDRDGTLIEDVPYCGDPRLVRPLPGVEAGLGRLRDHGVKLAVVSNQSGLARGFFSERQLAAVNSRVEELLGPLGAWFICPHPPEAGCSCRKPRPGLIEQAAAQLGVAPHRCAVIGDIGADVEAALAARARPVLVPTERTRREEILSAPEVAATFAEAVETLLGTATALSRPKTPIAASLRTPARPKPTPLEEAAA